MAKIEVDFTQMPIPPEIGVDFEDTWDTKASAVLNWQRVNQYSELTAFKTQANDLRDEVNEFHEDTVEKAGIATEVLQSVKQLEKQTETNANRAEASEDKCSQYKDEVEDIANNLVIPTNATYNAETIDSKLKDIEMRHFLKFNI